MHSEIYIKKLELSLLRSLFFFNYSSFIFLRSLYDYMQIFEIFTLDDLKQLLSMGTLSVKSGSG
jgi:hypothetical protein